jgi:hypothetical protein
VSTEQSKPLPFMVGYANLAGTHLQGYLNVPFSKVVEVFGQPQALNGDGDGKVAYQWAITFADGTVASIYDYKASTIYNGEFEEDDDGNPTSTRTEWPTPQEMREQDFCDWHIGGKEKRAEWLVREAITSPRKAVSHE